MVRTARDYLGNKFRARGESERVGGGEWRGEDEEVEGAERESGEGEKEGNSYHRLVGREWSH